MIGDDLDPEEVTRLLGAAPTMAHRKNEIIPTKYGATKTRIAQFGLWSRQASDQSPEDLDRQIDELLGGLTTDLSIWGDLTAKFRTDVFCGLFMRESNEGFTLKPHTLIALGSRGIQIDFDIYSK